MNIKILLIMLLFFTNNIMAKSIALTDQADRKIVLEDIPKRVVTIASPAGSMVVTLSNDKKVLVGTSPNSHDAIKEGVLDEFFPYLKNLSSSFLPKEDAVNIETLLELKPDLVLQWARNLKSINALESAGLKVVGMKYSKLDIQKTWLRDIGIILDQQEKAKEILQWHEDTYQSIIAKTKNIKNEKKPSVLYLLNEELAAGSLSHFQFFMDTAGAKNALNIQKKFINIDTEMLLLSNPDIIWLFGFNMKMTPKEIYSNPLFADLNAVKNKRVYKVPVGGDRWDPPNQELPLALEWFTRTVHPNLLEGSIRTSIKNAYPLLYSNTPNEKQLDKILRMKMNINSANYKEISR